jgi:hypothetical protein
MSADSDTRPYTVEELAKDHEESIIFFVDGPDPEKIISFMVARSEFPRVPAIGETIEVSLERTPGVPVSYEHYTVARVKWFVRVSDARGKDGTLANLRIAIRKTERPVID